MKSIALALVLAAALAACGKQETPAPATAPAPAAPAPAPAAAPAADPAAENTLGKAVYGRSCAMCHAAGVAGAPKPGDKVEWAPRIAQGDEVLNKHAIEGFTGSKGMMPPRGGTNATDDEVKAAVKFMVDQSR